MKQTWVSASAHTPGAVRNPQGLRIPQPAEGGEAVGRSHGLVASYPPGHGALQQPDRPGAFCPLLSDNTHSMLAGSGAKVAKSERAVSIAPSRWPPLRQNTIGRLPIGKSGCALAVISEGPRISNGGGER
jgi:hypothetical protein